MKNIMILLGISLAATTLVDVSFALRIYGISYVTATVVFFLAGFVFNNRIVEKPVLNSFLVLFFLFALMSFGYTVNFKAYNKWTVIIVCSLTGYAAGYIAKKMATHNNRVKSA